MSLKTAMLSLLLGVYNATCLFFFFFCYCVLGIILLVVPWICSDMYLLNIRVIYSLCRGKRFTLTVLPFQKQSISSNFVSTINHHAVNIQRMHRSTYSTIHKIDFISPVFSHFLFYFVIQDLPC